MSEVDMVVASEMVPSSAADEPFVVKSVAVEEDLKNLLPSVKNLAIAFASENRVHHNSITSEKMDIVHHDDDGAVVIRKPAAESYVPPYNYSYHPAESNSNLTIQNGSIVTTNGECDVDVVRARSKSPIPAAANLRSSIAFFENLKK